MVLHHHLFRSSQESWLSEIVMIMNYPQPKLLLAQAQAAAPIFTSYGPSGLHPITNSSGLWEEKQDPDLCLTITHRILHSMRLMNFVRWSICEEKKYSQICVVENIADMWVIESSGIYKGHYHILGGTLNSVSYTHLTLPTKA